MLRATLSSFLSTPHLSSPVNKTLIPSPFSLLCLYPFSSRRRQKSGDEDSDSSSLFFNGDSESPPKLLVVQPRLRPDTALQWKLAEALNLAKSLEEQRDGFYAEDFASKKTPPHLVVQNPSSRSVKADKYFGPGTVENIKLHLSVLKEKDQVDAVFVNAILSGIQQRNLEMAWTMPVLDRVGLIIEIFNAHAETKEAKLQAELAALMYKKSRLVRVRGPGGRLTFGASGEAEVVSARGRGSGGRGFISGAGETELQLQRQRIQERRNYLLSEIAQVRQTRAIHRSARKRRGGSHGEGLPTVAIVGYTNAGKSTLLSAVSESDVYSDDRLFATVDPRVRSVILPSGKKVLLSDTVGFISDLPVQLVEAFRATLEEVVEADLLVHVLDASASNLDEQRETVLEVLQQIGVSDEKMQNMIEVWNKIDLLGKDSRIFASLGEDESLSRDVEGCETVSGDECLSGGEEGDKVISRDECISGGEEGDKVISGDECFSGDEDENDTIAGEECLSGVEGGAISEMEGGFISDQDKHGMASNISTEETVETVDVQEAMSFKKKRMRNLQASPDAKGEHVETSAVMGIGLQELLSVIDKKLMEQKSIVTRSFGPYDRKWRPSYATDTEKVTQQ